MFKILCLFLLVARQP